jgi:hypothetical protein
LRWAAPVIFISLLLILAPGCGGGGSTSNSASLRFVQGSPDAPAVDFVVDGTTQTSNILYGNASAYVTVKSGSRDVQIIPVNSSSPVLTQKISLADSARETLLMTGPVAQPKSVVLSDTTTTTTTSQVRVVNISNAMGPADVYILAPGLSLASATPVGKGVAPGQDTGYQSATVGTGSAGGNYVVYMTVPNTLNVYMSTGPLSFATSASQRQTVVILDAAGGGFTFSVLTDQ